MDPHGSHPRLYTPYRVQQTPRGSVVFCREHLVTDELKPKEAEALADALNLQHQVRLAL